MTASVILRNMTVPRIVTEAQRLFDLGMPAAEAIEQAAQQATSPAARRLACRIWAAKAAERLAANGAP